MVILNQLFDGCVHMCMKLHNFYQKVFHCIFQEEWRNAGWGKILLLIEMLGVSWLFNKWIHHDSDVSRETLKVIP